MQNPSVTLQKVGHITIEDQPVPQIESSNQVKVQVKKTGICGSDIHYYVHGSIGKFILNKPMVLGHESSGVVVEVGSSVTSLKVGDRVAIEPGVPSRLSDEYKSGHYNLCPCMVFAATPNPEGPNPPGTLAKYFISPEDFLVKLPDHVSYEAGALVEPLSVGVHCCNLANVTFGDKVAVYGAGPVGLLAAAVAKSFGATEILLIDIFDSKLKLAQELGATHIYNSSGDRGISEDEAVAKQIKAFGGHVPNIVIDCTGAEACIRGGIKLIKAGGTYVQVGMGKDDVNFPIAEVGAKELVVKGSFRYGYNDYRTAVKLLEQRKIDVEKLVTHRFSFDKAIDAYNLVKEGKAIKCIIDGPL